MNNYDKMYQYLKDYVNKYGFSPSVREISNALDFNSTSTVTYYLKQLESDGKITRSPYKNRSIELKEYRNRGNTCTIPIIGKIAAGNPIMAVEQQTGELVFSDHFFRGNDLFILKISGDSMINVGIYNNDYVVINKQNTAQNGEIVAAMIDGEATVKRFYREPNGIRLQPENSFMRPIYSSNVEVIGKVVGVIRAMV